MTPTARIASLLLGCVLPGMAAAQTVDPTTEPAAVHNADARPHGPIRLNIVVTPSGGSAAIPDLQQSAFTLLDNGQPQPLTAFRAVSGDADPVKILFVIDAVNISFTRLSYERNQLEAFLRSHDGALSQPTAIALVTDTTVEATPDYTTDGNALSKVVEDKVIGLRDLRRSSGFYGAEDRLDVSLRGFRNLLAKESTLPGRKAVVWISPGWPLLSGPAVQLTNKQWDGIFQEVVGLSTVLRQANVTLYSVDPLGAGENPLRTSYYEEFLKGAKKPSDVLPGNLGLQVLAVQSGGLALNSSNDVKGMLQRCADDTRAVYEISFDPPPNDAPNAYHKLEVKVAEPRLKARTRQGYYSQP